VIEQTQSFDMYQDMYARPNFAQEVKNQLRKKGGGLLT
jgi:hypothetical protein